MINLIKKRFNQLRLSSCNRKIKRLNKKITELNIRRESAYTTRDRLVLAINNGHYGYDEIVDFERSKSSEIAKLDYEVCALKERINFFTNQIVEERNRIFVIKRSL